MSAPPFVLVAVSDPLKDDGAFETRTIPNELRALQELVGGWVEEVRMLTLRDGHLSLYINEEGRMKNLPLNAHATVRAGQAILGTVLLVRSNVDGDLVDLTKGDLEWYGEVPP